MFFARCAAQCSYSVCQRCSVSHICFALVSCYRSEWTIRAVTTLRHCVGTASEELHLKNTTQKAYHWLMALWRNLVISLGYLIFSGGHIWRTSDCFLSEVLSILTEGHREEASRHVCGHMRTWLWHLPYMYWHCDRLFSWGLFLPLGCQQLCTIFSFSEQLLDMWTMQELLAQDCCLMSCLWASRQLWSVSEHLRDSGLEPAATPCSSGHSWLCHYACSKVF